MLTLQFINENPEHVIERLAVKHFDGRPDWRPDEAG